MVEEQLKKWIRSLPPSELEKPIMMVDGKPLTPIDVAREVQKRSDVGLNSLRKAQSITERKTPVSPEEFELVEKRFEMLPEGIKVVRLDGYELSKEQMIEELKKKSKVGEMLAQREMRYLKYILSGK